MKDSIAKTGMTILQVAERYNVHPNTVHNWVRYGWLKPTKLGGKIFFTPQALQSFERRKN